MEAFGAIGVGLVLLWSYAAIIWIPAVCIYSLFKAAQYFTRKVKKLPASSTSKGSVTSDSGQVSSSPELVFLHWVITLCPIMLFTSMSLLAWRASILLGHWPEVMVDDPTWIGQNDSFYQWLYDWTNFSFGLAGCALIIWPILLISIYNLYSHKQRRSLIWAYIFAWMLALLGTGNGIAWYMD